MRRLQRSGEQRVHSHQRTPHDAIRNDRIQRVFSTFQRSHRRASRRSERGNAHSRGTTSRVVHRRLFEGEITPAFCRRTLARRHLDHAFHRRRLDLLQRNGKLLYRRHPSRRHRANGRPTDGLLHCERREQKGEPAHPSRRRRTRLRRTPLQIPATHLFRTLDLLCR